MYLLAPDEPHKGETGPCVINSFYLVIYCMMSIIDFHQFFITIVYLDVIKLT